MPKILFQSSLPRAGSTLLQNIMAQNPDVYATPTSGLMELIYGARKNYSEVPEYKASTEKEVMRKAFLAFCNGALHSYAEAITDKKYYLDKGRSWGFYMDWLETFLPYQPKIICMVRDLKDIFCSMEKLFRKNPELDNSLIDWNMMRNTTISKRMDFFANGIPIGIALDRLESIIQTGNANKFLFVKFEDFCLRPEMEMARIYNYLEIPHFNHNFDEIKQVTDEDDSLYSLTDHKIRPRVELPQSDALQILGPGVCEWINQRYFWFYDYFKYNR